MHQHDNQEFLLGGQETYHNILTAGLNAFEQEYVLRGILMPEYVANNIATLRNIIQTTVNENVLERRFKTSLSYMGTWAEFFNILSVNDLAIKSYMNIVLDGNSKDNKIAELRATIQQLNQHVQDMQVANTHNIAALTQQNTNNFDALREEFNKDRNYLNAALEKSNIEITLLKTEIQQLLDNGLGAANSKIAELEAQNAAKNKQIVLMQQQLISSRKAEASKPLSLVKNLGGGAKVLNKGVKV